MREYSEQERNAHTWTSLRRYQVIIRVAFAYDWGVSWMTGQMTLLLRKLLAGHLSWGLLSFLLASMASGFEEINVYFQPNFNQVLRSVDR